METGRRLRGMVLAAAALASSAGSSLAQDKPLDDAAADEAVATFADDMKVAGHREDYRIEAILRLGQVPHPRVVRILAPYLTGRCVKERIVAARALGEFKEVDGTVRALVDAVQNEANRGDATLGVRISIVRSLGTLRARETAPLVNAAIADPVVWMAKAGVDAAAQLRHRSSIEPLLHLLGRISSKDGNGLAEVPRDLADVMDVLPGMSFGLPNVVRGVPAADADKRPTPTEREILRQPILEALSAITGHKYRTYGDWQRWWRENRRTFEGAK